MNLDFGRRKSENPSYKALKYILVQDFSPWWGAIFLGVSHGWRDPPPWKMPVRCALKSDEMARMRSCVASIGTSEKTLVRWFYNGWVNPTLLECGENNNQPSPKSPFWWVGLKPSNMGWFISVLPTYQYIMDLISTENYRPYIIKHNHGRWS